MVIILNTTVVDLPVRVYIHMVSISARTGAAVPVGNQCGSVNPPKIARGYQEMCGVDFGYGESEYEVSFGLAPRIGELSPSVPEIPDPFNPRSGPGTRNGVQIRTPRKIWGR